MWPIYSFTVAYSVVKTNRRVKRKFQTLAVLCPKEQKYKLQSNVFDAPPPTHTHFLVHNIPTTAVKTQRCANITSEEVTFSHSLWWVIAACTWYRLDGWDGWDSVKVLDQIWKGRVVLIFLDKAAIVSVSEGHRGTLLSRGVMPPLISSVIAPCVW